MIKDTACDFCGEETKGIPYITLSVYGVWNEENKGLFVHPIDPPNKLDSWDQVFPVVYLHTSCVINYFEGMQSTVNVICRRT